MKYETNPSNSREKFSRVALPVLAAVWILHCGVDLALFAKTEVPPYYDAANHTNIALDIRDHYTRFEPTLRWLNDLYDLSDYYPPCYHLVAAGFLLARPHTLDSVRLPNLLFLAVLMLSVYLWGSRLFDPRTGLLAGILVSFFPVVHGLTREIYVDLALLAWSAAGAFLVWESDRFRRKGIAFLFGIVCGLGLLTKWTYPVFIGLPVLWVFSEMFFPISPSKWIGTVFGGAKNDPREGLLRAGIAAGCWFGFLMTTTSLVSGNGVPAVSALLGPIFLIPLVRVIREALRSPGFAQAWNESRRPLPPLFSGLMGIVVAAIPCLTIAGPWYWKHFGFIASEGARVLTEAAQVRGMAEVRTAESMLYYFLTLESHQLRLPLWGLAILSLASLFTRKGRLPSTWLLGGTFALSYVTMSSLWVKDPRYFTPALYPLAILMAWWLLSRNPSGRKAWIAGTFTVVLLGYLNQVAGLPGLSFKLDLPTPFSQPLTVTGPAPYGDLIRHNGNWPHRLIVEGIEKHREHVSHLEGPLEIPVLVDDGYLHAPALNCYARMLGSPLRFYNVAYRPDYRRDPGWTSRLLTLLRSPYLLTKEEGSLGLDFVARVYRPLLEKLFGEQEAWGEGLQALAIYPLPEGGTATLWRNRFPPAFLGRRHPVSIKFENGVRLTGYRMSTRNLDRKGESFVLQVDWVPEPAALLKELTEGYQFFLHLVESRDGRFVQGWNFPLATESLDVARFQIQSGSPPAVLSTRLIEVREDLAPGVYRWRLGVFRTDRLDPVPLSDPIGSIETHVKLGEPFVFEPAGWEWIDAEFEDRAALSVRDEIGSLVLESAKFEPTELSPGDSLHLDCQWAFEWLELEAPEERDIRGFAYLLPVSATSGSGQTARRSWVLDAEGQQGSGRKRWKTRVRIPIPSDLPEGEWRVCVGVERPLYRREMIVRNGHQAGRNAFCLSHPLLVGYSPWSPVHAAYEKEGLLIQGARVREASAVVGANLRLEIAWKAESATAMAKSASECFLFVHLFSEIDRTYAQIESFPLFRKDRIPAIPPAISTREGLLFYQGIRSGFREVYTFRLDDTLPPGNYRIDFGLFRLKGEKKVPAVLPGGSESNTLSLPSPVEVHPLE